MDTPKMDTPVRGSGESRKIASRTQTTTMHNWKIVKNFSTSMAVLRRFGVKCRIETTWVEIQCIASPKLAVTSTQTQLERSTQAENTATKTQPRRHYVGKAQGACKDLALGHDVFRPILLTFIGMQALIDLARTPPGENFISITQNFVAVAVIVWFIARIAAKKKILFLCSIGVLVCGARADNSSESSKPEDRNDDAEATALTVLVAVLTIGGAGVAKRMCNRWRPLPVVPGAPAAAAAPAAVAAVAAIAAAPVAAAPAAPAPAAAARAAVAAIAAAPAAAAPAAPAPAAAALVAAVVVAVIAAAPAAPAPAALAPAAGPAFDIMGGLDRSPVPTHDNPTYNIRPRV